MNSKNLEKESNWAVMHFDNWNIHHTYEKNWIRNSLILMDGWQFSDNQRGWIIKSGFTGRIIIHEKSYWYLL